MNAEGSSLTPALFPPRRCRSSARPEQLVEAGERRESAFGDAPHPPAPSPQTSWRGGDPASRSKGWTDAPSVLPLSTKSVERGPGGEATSEPTTATQTPAVLPGAG